MRKAQEMHQRYDGSTGTENLAHISKPRVSHLRWSWIQFSIQICFHWGKRVL